MPSEKSKAILGHLKGIGDDETLVRETRFLLGETIQGSHYQPASPLKTNSRLQYDSHESGQLKDMLTKAMSDLERY